MQQTTFNELHSLGVISQIDVVEALPTKGKPALRGGDAPKRIWTVTVRLGSGQEDQLESSRGGIREWASLDRLTEWLRQQGVVEYNAKLLETHLKHELLETK